MKPGFFEVLISTTFSTAVVDPILYLVAKSAAKAKTTSNSADSKGFFKFAVASVMAITCQAVLILLYWINAVSLLEAGGILGFFLVLVAILIDHRRVR